MRSSVAELTFDLGKCRNSCVVAFPWARGVPVLCDISSCEDLYQPGSHAESLTLGRRQTETSAVQDSSVRSVRCHIQGLTRSIGSSYERFVFKSKRSTGWNSAVRFPHLASHL